MNNYLSARAIQIKPSATVAANDKAKKLKASGIDIINLTAGQPDFHTPDFIKEAGIDAINENKTGYTPVCGVPELKQAIINKLKRDNNLDYSEDQIIVSCGVKQCLFNLTQATLGPGDEAIVLAPYWVSYPSMVSLAGATPVVIQAGIEQHYKITPEQLEAAITQKTKMVFFNSPSNPSGACYTLEELKKLADVLKKHPNILIVSDDIYEYILWGQPQFHNIVNAEPALYDRTIVMNGVAKAHCMTGWRIGFAACHPTLMNAMKKIQSQSTTCATSIAQHAAVAAFSATADQFFPPMLSAYKERHDWVINAINSIPGLNTIPSEGTFYAFIDARELIQSMGFNDDIELNNYILEKANVALVPGSAFGSPGYLRLSFATSMENLEKAITKLKESLKKA
jgi:aspartate aminotransferase